MSLLALVCDDDTTSRAQVTDMLKSQNVTVIEAGDGQEALAVFMKEKVDLVVTDFLMPKVDGLQVIRNIRLSGERGDIPIVLMSAISNLKSLPANPSGAPITTSINHSNLKKWPNFSIAS